MPGARRALDHSALTQAWRCCRVVAPRCPVSRFAAATIPCSETLPLLQSAECVIHPMNKYSAALVRYTSFSESQ